jgi:predicted Zn-dependent protease with MMP-like domain
VSSERTRVQRTRVAGATGDDVSTSELLSDAYAHLPSQVRDGVRDVFRGRVCDEVLRLFGLNIFYS